MMDRPAHLEETIAVFELLDEQPELEAQGVSPAELMKGNALPEGYDEWVPESDVSAEEIQQNGGQVYYHHEADGWFYLLGDYAPEGDLSGDLVLAAHLSTDEDALQGDVVDDAYLEIIRATPAPYLERGVPDDELEQYVAEDSIGILEVPADYDQDALERSVETAVQRFSAAVALQDAVVETAAEYAEDLTNGSQYHS